ncbi:MAG: tetratricopeptide repeat protein [Acidobacteriota bacterium]
MAQALRALVTFEMPVIEPVGALRGAAKKDHGLELYAAGDYEAAVIELESSVSARRPDLLHVLGACHLRAGRARAAIDSLTRAVKGLPHSADTHWLLAQAHLLNDDPESATKSLKKVEKLGGDLGEAAATLQEQLAKLLES